jgi:hypothetical protein
VRDLLGEYLRPSIGARVFTPQGPGVLTCVTEAYLTVKLEADGSRIRYHDAGVILLYVDSRLTEAARSSPGGLLEITESPKAVFLGPDSLSLTRESRRVRRLDEAPRR